MDDTEQPLLFERFRPLRRLGRGGHATVYLARDVDSGALVALKVIEDATPELIDRLRVQGVAQQLRHPNIVHVVEPWLVGDHPLLGAAAPIAGIALEYVDGTPLDRHLRNVGGFMPRRELLETTLDIARAVAHAHAQVPSIVHRDIKPSNVLIREHDGTAMLTDFGHALVLRHDTQRLTRSQVALGTRRFAAPELMLDAKRASTAADVYGIGAVMHFTGGELVDVDLSSLIESFMESDPQRRPAHAGIVAELLEQLLVSCP